MSSRTWTPVLGALCTSAKDAALPDDTCRLFFARLLLIVDSYGCVDLAEHVLHAKLWPLHNKPMSETSRSIQECCKVGLLAVHQEDDRRWLRIPDWEEKAGKVMRPERRGKPEFTEATESNRVEYSGSAPGNSGSVPESHSRAKTDRQTDQKEKDRSERESPRKRGRRACAPFDWQATLSEFPKLDTETVRAALTAYLQVRPKAWTNQGMRLALRKVEPGGPTATVTAFEDATEGPWLTLWPRAQNGITHNGKSARPKTARDIVYGSPEWKAAHGS